MELKKDKLIINVFILLLFFIQLNYIFKIGATYDIAGLRYGAGLSIKRGLNFLSITNYSLPSLNEAEYFGMLFLIPSYLFGHLANIIFGNNLIDGTTFLTNDHLIYTSMFVFFNIYLFACIYYLFHHFRRTISTNFSFIFIIFLYLYPTYIGHSMFNIKDISFSIQLFISSLLYISFINTLKYEKNKPSKNLSIEINKLCILFSTVLLTRLNGIVFLGLLSFFGLITVIKQKKLVKYFLIVNIKIYLISFLSLIIFSPSSWHNPTTWLINTFNHQFFHKFPGLTLTNGRFIDAQNISQSYLLEWFLYRTPLVYILLFFSSIFLILKNKNFTEFYKFSLFFIVTINLAFIILKPTAYDGIRQYLFLFPFIIYVCTENLIKLEKTLKIKYVIFVTSILYLIFSQYSLGQYKYIYFNEFVNENKISIECEVKNIDGCGIWFSDYLGISGKDLMIEFEKFVPRNSELLVCRPEHVFEKFLNPENKEINVFWSNDNFNNDIFYVASLHRPRGKPDISTGNGDSCNFFYLDKQPSCEIVYEEKVIMRSSEIILSYINKCSLN